MSLILIILVVILLFGGGGFYGYRSGGLSGPFPGLIGIIVVLVVLYFLLGHGHAGL